MPLGLTINLSAEGLDEWSDVDFFLFFERVNTEENPFPFVTIHQPQTFHEYCRCILAIFTMPHKDIELVNCPSSVLSRTFFAILCR